MALKRIGAKFEHYLICEWEIHSVASYKAIHMPYDNVDYSDGVDSEKIIEELTKLGISADGKTALSENQIRSHSNGETWRRNCYNNIKATHNLVNICSTHGNDLKIIDTEHFTYLLTYSFPCTDLSVAGKQAGMSKGSGTRSGLLWEVERILTEIRDGSGELPQILFMENVPQVHGKKNIDDFEKWLEFLESLGYTNYWQDLNAKNYGVAQNRNRCFMFSFLGNYSYNFPEPIQLKKKLKDYLEDNVDEKYYINNEKADKLIKQLIDNGTLPQHNLDRQTDRLALMEQSISRSKEKLQTVSKQDMTQESQICGRTETLLLKGMVDKDIEPTASVIDVSTTIMARDYKGLNNYGTNGVIEWK